MLNQPLPSHTQIPSPITSVFDLPKDLLELTDTEESASATGGMLFPGRPLDIEESAANFGKTLIRYTAFETCMEAIAHCHHMGFFKADEPDCLLITGVSGAGKSTLRKEYAKGFPRVEHEEFTEIPVLHMELPSMPTIKNVAERILIELDDPFAMRGSAEAKTARIVTLMRECRVQLVMLDEFQHFVDNAGVKVEAKVADWLKSLINATHVPFVLMGLPRCRRILEVNEQLRRRFSPQLTMPAFGLDTAQKRREFAGLLNTLQQQLPFTEPSVITRPEVIPLMYYATNGLIDYVMKLIKAALYIALKEGRTSIDQKVLEKAFSRAIWAAGSGAGNPFHTGFKVRPLNQAGEPFYGYH